MNEQNSTHYHEGLRFFALSDSTDFRSTPCSDVQQYFPSINHGVLLDLIEQKVACKDTLWLIRTILNPSQKYGKSGPILAPTDRPTDRPTNQLVFL